MSSKNQTVKELQVIAKERGLRGYSKLKKAELIALLDTKPKQVKPAEAKPKPVKQVMLAGFDAWADEQLAKPSKPTTSTTWSEWLADRVPIPEGLGKWADEQLAKPIKQAVSTTHDWIMNKVPQPVKNVVDAGFHKLKNEITKLFGKTKNKPAIRESKTAIKGFAKQYVVDGIAGVDAVTFLNSVKAEVVNLISKNRQTKVNMVLSCEMERVDMKSGEVINTVAPFVSKTEVVLEGTDVGELYNKATDRILESIAKFQMMGSNWRLKFVSRLEINTTSYKPLEGKSYIKLPPELEAKKAIINMKNEDNQCFKWCVTRALNQVEHNSEKITKQLKIQATKLNWEGIEFPVAVDENVTKKFERNNGVGINIFGYESGKGVFPLILSEHSGTVIDLLLISEGEKKHYCWIKNFNKLLAVHTEKSTNSMHYCRRCLTGYKKVESLNKHNEYCSMHDAIKIKMPEPGSVLKFKNHCRSMRVPFTVIADFESFIKPISTCQPNPNGSYTNKFQKHTPSSFCYHIKCFDDAVYKQSPVTFTAESKDDDVAQIFVDTLEKNIKEIYQQFKFPKKMIFTKDDEIKFNAATTCHICEKEIKKKSTDHCHVTRRNKDKTCIICKQDLDDETKVRDHCHLSGKFRGAAHNGCNLNYKLPTFFPVFLHNLSGYDGHLIIKKLRSVVDNGEKITCIPTNEEKYISFSKKFIVDEFTNTEGKTVSVKRDLRFIDSFRFMPSSLEALSNNLTDDQCCELAKEYSGEQFQLIRKKGVYPYDYMDSIEKLNETKLPPKAAFYSKLNDSDISDQDYAHAQEVWNVFNCRTMRDYHDLYNKSDVLLLSDVVENFRDVCIKNYKLDPAWYYTAPGLSWDAALKMTGVELELLSDIDMLRMVQQGIRGGVSTISNRYARANNVYMGEAFDVSKPSTFITYLDAVNLYGYAMKETLPVSCFKWMSEEELNNWKSISSKEGEGCILEVDLKYPKKLHDLHSDYPLAPQNIVPEGSKVAKLIPNLNNKIKYVVHHKNLKLYESLGLKITKIHRGICFKEEAWLKKYIDLNTQLRTMANNDFEVDFFKLMIVSVFGKTMQNIEKHVDLRLVTNEKEALKLSARVNYDRCTIFDENLVAVHMKKTELFYDKPIYLGMCILDISKTLIVDFHYNYIKNKYGDRAKLLFTDTDSLAYEIKTEDFYANIANDVEMRFDTSNYPKNHPSGIKTGVNKKVIGMFKDEAAGKQIEEFVGLRAKLYSYKMFEGEENKKCKGVKKNVVQNSITHDDYKKALFSRQDQYRIMNVIRSYHHELYTEQVNKIALSSNDDKRVILEDGIHTLAIGHWKLKKLI